VGFIELSLAELRRTTDLIGELIALTVEQEQTLTWIGREGYALYKANRIYDETTLELCRKVESTHRMIEEQRQGLRGSLEREIGPRGRGGAEDTARQMAVDHLVRRETQSLHKMLREDHDELGRRLLFTTANRQGTLTPRLLRLCARHKHLSGDIDRLWAELQERTRQKRGGPSFILILNMFVVNLFRFANYTWFREWVQKLDYYREGRFEHKVHEKYGRAEEETAEAEVPGPAGAPADHHGAPADRPGGFFRPYAAEGDEPEPAAPRPAPEGARTDSPGAPADRPGGFFRPHAAEGDEPGPAAPRPAPGRARTDSPGAPADRPGGFFRPQAEPEEETGS
jgi:hypothetical protein